MKVITQYIKECSQCPYYRNIPNDADDCLLMSLSANPQNWQLVPPKNGIPFWCPLPDEEKKGEKSC